MTAAPVATSLKSTQGSDAMVEPMTLRVERRHRIPSANQWIGNEIRRAPRAVGTAGGDRGIRGP
jgi:hypothetical protein